MLLDLNVPWPVNDYTQKPNTQQMLHLKNTIATLCTFGYTHIAINFILHETVRIPNNSQDSNPIDIEALRNELVGKFPNLRLFTRLTLVVSDPAQCLALSKVQGVFDILAIQPTTEKALQLATSNLDIDIVSFNLTSRIPFFLKHKTICSGVDKGIKFEICYSATIAGPAGYVVTSSNDNMTLSTTAMLARKNFFSNALQLIRASRSRGLIVSSGATRPLHVRNLSDVLYLLKSIGLDSSRAKSCISLSPERALINGRLRIKSYKQTILIDNDLNAGDILYSNDKEDSKKKTNSLPYKKKLSDTSSGRLLKRRRKK